MELGAVVDVGFYLIIMCVVIAILIACLMVSHTPKHLGQKIETKEIKMAVLVILCLQLAMLSCRQLPRCCLMCGNLHRHARSSRLLRGHSTLQPQVRLTTGSAFDIFTDNTPCYNITIGLAMLLTVSYHLLRACHCRLAGHKENSSCLPPVPARTVVRCSSIPAHWRHSHHLLLHFLPYARR